MYSLFTLIMNSQTSWVQPQWDTRGKYHMVMNLIMFAHDICVCAGPSLVDSNVLWIFVVSMLLKTKSLKCSRTNKCLFFVRNSLINLFYCMYFWMMYVYNFRSIFCWVPKRKKLLKKHLGNLLPYNTQYTVQCCHWSQSR